MNWFRHDHSADTNQALANSKSDNDNGLVQEAAADLIAADVKQRKGILQSLTPKMDTSLKADTPKMDPQGIDTDSSKVDSSTPKNLQDIKPHNYFTDDDKPKAIPGVNDSAPPPLEKFDDENVKDTVQHTKEVQATCLQIIGYLYNKADLADEKQALNLISGAPKGPFDKDKLADLVEVLDQGIPVVHISERHYMDPSKAGLKDLRDFTSKMTPAPWLNTPNELGPYWQTAQNDVKSTQLPLAELEKLVKHTTIDAACAQSIARQTGKIMQTCDKLYEDWDKLFDERSKESTTEHDIKKQAQEEAKQKGAEAQVLRGVDDTIKPYKESATALDKMNDAAIKILTNLNDNFPRKGLMDKLGEGMAAVGSFGATAIIDSSMRDPDCKERLSQDLDAINAACHQLRDNFKGKDLFDLENDTTVSQTLSDKGLPNSKQVLHDFRQGVTAAFLTPDSNGKTYLDEVQKWSSSHSPNPGSLYKQIEQLQSALQQSISAREEIDTFGNRLKGRINELEGHPDDDLPSLNQLLQQVQQSMPRLPMVPGRITPGIGGYPAGGYQPNYGLYSQPGYGGYQPGYGGYPPGAYPPGYGGYQPSYQPSYQPRTYPMGRGGIRLNFGR